MRAEGIERPLELQRLREIGCELGQGYLFSRPIDASALDRFLAAPLIEPSVRMPDDKVIGIAGRRATG